MSSINFTFNPALIPAEFQAAFMARFFQLVTEYQIVTSPVPASPFDGQGQPASPFDGQGLPASPPAESLPPLSSFVTMVEAEVAAKPARKNPWAGLSEEQRAERLAKMAAGRDAKKAARKMSDDSLNAPAPVEAVNIQDPYDAMTTQQLRTTLAERTGADVEGMTHDAVPLTDAASETSSSKKPRKNPWANLTPEQHAAKVAAMKAAREAKKAAASAV